MSFTYLIHVHKSCEVGMASLLDARRPFEEDKRKYTHMVH